MKPKIHIVLVRPMYASNIGFVARVCSNMGADSFNIVTTEKNYLEENAKKRAASAQNYLRGANIYPDLKSFYQEAGEGIRVGFTRRAGKQRPTPLWNDYLSTYKNDLIDKAEFQNLYLFFGPEDDGLSAEDLDYTNVHAQLPIYGENGSYNLAHAVLLACYIFRDNISSELTNNKEHINDEQQTKLHYSDKPLRQWLECLGMDNSHPKKSAAVAINKMILRSTPTYREIQIWNKIVNATVRLLSNIKEEDRWQRK